MLNLIWVTLGFVDGLAGSSLCDHGRCLKRGYRPKRGDTPWMIPPTSQEDWTQYFALSGSAEADSFKSKLENKKFKNIALEPHVTASMYKDGQFLSIFADHEYKAPLARMISLITYTDVLPELSPVVSRTEALPKCTSEVNDSIHVAFDSPISWMVHHRDAVLSIKKRPSLDPVDATLLESLKAQSRLDQKKRSVTRSIIVDVKSHTPQYTQELKSNRQVPNQCDADKHPLKGKTKRVNINIQRLKMTEVTTDGVPTTHIAGYAFVDLTMPVPEFILKKILSIVIVKSRDVIEETIDDWTTGKKCFLTADMVSHLESSYSQWTKLLDDSREDVVY